MEDGVIYYLLDSEDDWHTWTAQLQEALAVQTLQQWICSENFKEKATYEQLDEATFIGQKLMKLREDDQYWKDNTYKRLKAIQLAIYSYWREHRWVYEETTRNGRPRRAEHSREVKSKAMKYVNPPFLIEDSEEDTLYKSVYWSKSILGELSVQTWSRIVIIRENIYKQVYSKLGVEFFTGRTRDEIAEVLHLPKPFVNGLCRWLQQSGNWRIRQVKLNGERRRELQYTVV